MQIELSINKAHIYKREGGFCLSKLKMNLIQCYISPLHIASHIWSNLIPILAKDILLGEISLDELELKQMFGLRELYNKLHMFLKNFRDCDKATLFRF